MTRDDIIYHAMEHLIAQGERSVDADMCLMRGPNGTRCAVGFFLSDDEVSRIGNQAGISGAVIGGTAPAWMADHLDTLQVLQCVHDGAYSGEFTERFERFFREPYADFRARYLANRDKGTALDGPTGEAGVANLPTEGVV